MLSILHSYLVLLVLATATAFPLQSRDVQWSFDLFPTRQCNGTGDHQIGTGSTGCRAKLPSIAAAYKVSSLADCRIDFFDNTMCETSTPQEFTDAVLPSATLQTCRVPYKHHYGSYKVTCGDDAHSEI